MTEATLQEKTEADSIEVIKETPAVVVFKSYHLYADGSHTEAQSRLLKNSGEIVLDKIL